jgi:uncharacterized RDD family membrane protein YckC
VITGGLFLLVDALWPLFDRQGLALHDIAMQTRVVEVEQRVIFAPTYPHPTARI